MCRRSKTATGGGPVAMALQDKVAGAWVRFAKTGNPSQPELPWRPYTPDNPQAMIFDTISESRPLHDDKLVSAYRRHVGVARPR